MPGATCRIPRAVRLGALLVVAAATGCDSQSAERLPRAPITLAVGVAQPRGGTASDAEVARLSTLLQSAGIVALGRDGRAEPALAERWEASPDGLTWRFVLRESLTFHDGSPITSSTIADIVERDRAEPGPTGVAPGFRDVIALDTPTPRELVVRLARPSSLLLEALALTRIVGGDSGAHGAGPFRQPAGEGPERLEAFDGYFRGRPAIDRVELRSFPTARTAWVALMRGEIDFLHEVAPDAVEFVEAGTDVHAASFLRPYLYLLGFNVRHPVLRDQRVRVALNEAVDRPRLIARALAGRGLPAGGHVWPRHWAFDHRQAAFEFAPARAARQLDEAGVPLPARSDDGRPPSRIRLTCLLPADYPLFERLAVALQRHLLDIGVDLALLPLAPEELGRRLAEGNFDVYLLEMAGGPGLGWPYWFWRSPEAGRAWVASGYAGADRALDAVRTAPTDDGLREAVADLQQTMRTDPPALFLFWGETARAVRQRFEIPAESDRDLLSSLAQWRVRTGG